MSIYLKDDKVLLDSSLVATSSDCCCVVDCTSCDDLPPTNPMGPPVHINMVMTLSGGCGGVTASGSLTYDTDLTFHLEGPVGGHNFCAHDIWENGQGHGDFWTGEWTLTCDTGGTMNFGQQGAASLFGRDVTDCSWWTFLPTFNIFAVVGDCTGCNASLNPIPFQEISGPGDPSGVYIFSDSDAGITLSVTITIT